MNSVEILKLLSNITNKTNNACLKLDVYYIMNGLPIDKK